MKYIKYLLLLLTLLASQSAFAQAIYSLKFNLADEHTSEPVPFATASVTVKGETTPAKYTLSDDKGHVSIVKLKKGTYLLKVEMLFTFKSSC